MAGLAAGASSARRPSPARLERLARELGVPAERLACLDGELAWRIEERLRELREAAAVDELTGALRRPAGLAALEREVRRARRHGDRHLSVAFIDGDSLKAVNDTFGHAAGDELLRALAETLRRRLRAYDMVIRWGGDEFVCVVHARQQDAERVMAEASAQLLASSGLSFSAGFAEITPGDTAETLVARADADLYARRRRGKGRDK